MYIRIKQLKKQKYAYLVKNKRYKRRKHPKQITTKYLGRLYTPPKIGNKVLYEPNVEKYFKNTSSNKIIKNLMEIELINHNFKKQDKVWKQEDMTIDLSNNKITNIKENPIAIELNEGFLTNYTLKQLLNYKFTPEISLMQQGQTLANLLVSAGIKIEDEIFLRLFEKIHNP